MVRMFKRKERFVAVYVIFLFFYGYVPLARAAGFGIDSTRVILEQQAGSATVYFRNTSDTPYLVRASVLDDKWKEVKGLVINPGIIRMDGDTKSAVRLLYSPSFTLPQDRESVFYLHCTVIASGAELDELPEINKGTLKVAVGTRVKIFFRPPAIAAPKKENYQQLKFTKDSVSGGLHVENPTPYHVSLLRISVDGDGIDIPREYHMIPPFGKQTYSIKENVSHHKIQWSVINDLGAEVVYNGVIE